MGRRVGRQHKVWIMGRDNYHERALEEPDKILKYYGGFLKHAYMKGL